MKNNKFRVAIWKRLNGNENRTLIEQTDYTNQRDGMIGFKQHIEDNQLDSKNVETDNNPLFIRRIYSPDKRILIQILEIES